MHSAIQHFRANISRVRALGGLYNAITQMTTQVVDASDLLRAQIVMAVSALDHYIHEITRIGMIEAYNGNRPQTDAFLRFQVTMEGAITGLTSGGVSSWFEAEIRERHSYLAFQHPDRIADAIRLFSSSDLWQSVSTILGLPKQDLKNHLRLIVERRNKIVHEADLDPSFPGTRWPIYPADAANATDFIEQLCEAIHSVII